MLHDIVARLSDFGSVLRTLTSQPNFAGNLVVATAPGNQAADERDAKVAKILKIDNPDQHQGPYPARVG